MPTSSFRAVDGLARAVAEARRIAQITHSCIIGLPFRADKKATNIAGQRPGMLPGDPTRGGQKNRL